MTRFTAALQNPVIALFASASTTGISVISFFIERGTPVLAFLTAFFACITGGCIAALWLRRVWRATRADFLRKSKR